MRTRIRRRKSQERVSEERTPFFKKKKDNFFGGENLQKKLNISKAGDQSEKQADAIADRVAKSPEGDKPAYAKASADKEEPKAKSEVMKKDEEETKGKSEVQKKEEEETKGKTEAQKKEEEETKGKLEVQRKDEPAYAKASADEGLKAESMIRRKADDSAKKSFEKRLKAAKSGGDALPEKVREEMEHKMKGDFSKVRIHTDDLAVALCSEIKAQAFTNGYHIFFNKGKYQPDSSAGKHLLAHELAHVMQQQ